MGSEAEHLMQLSAEQPTLADVYRALHAGAGWVNSNGQLMGHSYGWNRTGWTATMSLSASTWKPTIPPYWVTWIQWGGYYQNAASMISLPAGNIGELGEPGLFRFRPFLRLA
jgi:hypothetical protein